MFKTLFFITLIALAAAKSHKKDACIEAHCKAEGNACIHSQGCFDTMSNCQDPNNQGAPTPAEKACLQKDSEAWAFTKCMVAHCSEPQFSHRQSKIISKWSKRFAN